MKITDSLSIYKIFKKSSLKSGSVTNAFRMTINIDQHSENIIVISNFFHLSSILSINLSLLP
jgi:hypothetical protein